MDIMRTRQVKYNCKRAEKFDVECNEWWFLIVDENREIKEIENKIYSLFAPIVSEGESIKGKVKGMSLNYELINFYSTKKVEYNDLFKVHRNIRRDSKLYQRENRHGLEKYIEVQLND